MSRSYRKNLFIKESSKNHRNYPRPKAIANRTIRRNQKKLSPDDDDYDINRGADFKKTFESYNIHDYRFRYKSGYHTPLWRWRMK